MNTMTSNRQLWLIFFFLVCFFFSFSSFFYFFFSFSLMKYSVSLVYNWTWWAWFCEVSNNSRAVNFVLTDKRILLMAKITLWLLVLANWNWHLQLCRKPVWAANTLINFLPVWLNKSHNVQSGELQYSRWWTIFVTMLNPYTLFKQWRKYTLVSGFSDSSYNTVVSKNKTKKDGGGKPCAVSLTLCLTCSGYCICWGCCQES